MSAALHEISPPARVERSGWSYSEAFSRNLGLISAAEQERLRASRVAVAGLGGVGGIDLVTLARLGIGKFTIADPDVFEIGNTNRQYGATFATRGRSKCEVMGEIVKDINPEVELRLIRDPIGANNIDEFLDGADVMVDGIDAFEIDLRRLLFRELRKRRLYGLGAGPVGFSTAWVVFDPNGIGFDRYFDLSDDLSPLEKFVAYVIGMAPASTQRRYMDLSHLDAARRTGPSASLACQLASGVVAAEVLKILLKRGRIYPAPYYHQFDPYAGRYVRKRLRGGNRNPVQRIKRRWLVNYLTRHQGAGA